ncbi:hypothetical protein ACL02R_12580 [Streptomyces sp. MS19]
MSSGAVTKALAGVVLGRPVAPGLPLVSWERPGRGPVHVRGVILAA